MFKFDFITCFLIWHHFMAFILSLHFLHTMRTSIIMNTHFSLWPAAWVTFNEDELQLPLFLAATHFLECFMFHVSSLSFSLSQSTLHILRIESLLFKAWDRVLFHSSALARHRSFAGALVPILLPRASMVVHSKERVGGGVRSLALLRLFAEKLMNNHIKPPWLD